MLFAAKDGEDGNGLQLEKTENWLVFSSLEMVSAESPQKLNTTSSLCNNKHLMTGPNGNSEFCFPETLNVPRGEAEGNIEVGWRTDLPPFQRCTT